MEFANTTHLDFPHKIWYLSIVDKGNDNIVNNIVNKKCALTIFITKVDRERIHAHE